MHDPQAPPRGRSILVGGGVRCGKSAFALERARALGERRVFLATAQAGDAEMAQRIARHRQERGAAFACVEEPLDLVSALASLRDADVVVIDCLTLWLSNLLATQQSDAQILAHVDELVSALAAAAHHSVIVTNEVGMGLVPETPLGRRFRDLTGFAHQRIARGADEIYVGVLGAILRLAPGPVALATRGVIDEPAR